MRTSVMPQVQAGNTLAIPSGSELKGNRGGIGAARVKVSLFGGPSGFSVESIVRPMLSPTRVANA